MKKLYLLFMAIFIAGLSFGQTPSLNCPGDYDEGTDENVCTANLSIIDPTFVGGVSDTFAVGDMTYVLTGATTGTGTFSGPPTSIIFEKGVTTVTASQDWADAGTGSGTVTCSFTVTISDDQAPKEDTTVQVCGNTVTVELDGTGSGSLDEAALLALLTDNCTANADLLVTYSSSTFDCSQVGIQQTVTITVTDEEANVMQCDFYVDVDDNVAPVITTAAADKTIECVGDATIMLVQFEAWKDAHGGAVATDNCTAEADLVWSNNSTGLSDDCGLTGSETVVFTVTDAEGNTSTTSATFTIEDTTAPDVSNVGNLDDGIECLGASGNETEAGIWNNANVSAILANAADECGTVTVQNDFDYATNFVGTCGDAGSITVDYTVSDECLNTSHVTATFTIVDTTVPDLTGCADRSETVECVGAVGNEALADTWDADNIVALEGCATDVCSNTVTVTSDYDFATLTDGCGETGVLTTVYTVTDDCGNTSKVTYTFTIEDTTPPNLSNGQDPMDLDDAIECLGADGNETAAEAWALANQGDLANNSTDDCGNVTVTNDYDYANLVPSCGEAGTLTVTYTATDDCGNTRTVTATFTITDTTPPDLSGVDIASYNTIYECSGADGNLSAAEEWDAAIKSETDNNASDLCGTVTTTSDFDYGNLVDACGETGELTVNYTVSDECSNSSYFTAVFTIVDTTAPTIDTEASDETVECDGAGNIAELNAWLAANGGAEASDACSDESLVWTNDFTGLSDDCGETGSATVIFTVTDNCGNSSTTSATFTIEDTVGPVLDACASMDSTIECLGDPDNEAAAAAWDADNIVTLTGCALDDCSGSNITVTSDYDYGNLVEACGTTGELTVTYTVTDDCGNTSTTTAVFTIEDTTPPDLNNIITELQVVTLDPATCQATMPDYMATIAADATDVCDPVIDFNQFPYNAGDLILPGDLSLPDTLTVYVTGTDDCGNIDTAIVMVTFEDVTPPIAECQPTTVYLDESGAATIIPWDVDNGSYDACQEITPSVDVSTFDCSNVDTDVPVVLTITDPSGNAASCETTVTVLDTIAPDAVCQNITIELDDNGNATITATDVNGGSTDNCTVDMLEVDIDAFTCADLGDNTVVLTVTDQSGNESTCDATVTVEDNIAPDAVCKNITVELDDNGEVTIVAEDVDGGSTDNCTVEMLEVDIDAFTCADLGDNTVVLTVTDQSGNSSTCEATVTVEDNIAPVAICQNITIELDDNGDATITATDVDGGSTDNCTIVDWTVDIDAFTCEDLGENTVVLTVTDQSGNSSTCEATVTVEDNIAPDAVCQDVTVELDENGEVTIVAEDVDDGSTDNCTVEMLEVDIDAFTCEDLGENTVVLTVTDQSGNEGTCTATVTVEDNMPPVVITQDVTVSLDAAGEGSVTPTHINDESWDNCGIASMRLDGQTEYTCEDQGEHTVTLVVTDVNGNSASETATVTVVDDMAPVINPLPLTVILHENGEYVLNDAEIEFISKGVEGNATWDNCTDYEDMVIDITPRSFECLHVHQPAVVVVSATDLAGNTGTAEVAITVIDDTNPTMLCKDKIEVYLDGYGQAHIYPGDINDGTDRESVPAWARTYNNLEGGSWDACGIDSAWVSQQVFNCSDLGDNVVTLWMMDPSENTSSCQAIVTVIDTLPIEIHPVADVEVDVEPGVCSTTIEYPTPGVENNCGFTFKQIGGLGEDGDFPIGTTVETWVAIADGEATTDTVSFNVTITTSNAAPTIDAIADVEVDEDTPSATVALAGISDGGDCVAQAVTVTATGVNAAMVTDIVVNYTDGDATGSIDLTIAPLTFGTDTITVTVSDGVDETTETFVVTVVHVNHAPTVINPIDDQQVNASYPLTVATDNVFEDVDGDELAVVVAVNGSTTLPAWMTIDGTDIVCEPMIADTGSYTVTVTATDPDGASATDEFVIVVDGYPTAVEEINADAIEINMYPNPTRGLVNIKINSSNIADVDLAVLDITGKLVLRKQYSVAEEITFDMSGKVSGMYFVQIQTEGKQFVKKLVVDVK